MEYKIIPRETFQDCQENQIKGICDVYTGDLTVLAVSKSQFSDSYDHTILPEIISKEPLGPVVRHGDNHWADVVRWVLNVLIIAEEKNLTPENVDEYFEIGDSETLRLLGKIGEYGDMIELDNNWALNVIKQVGNYSTIYEKYIGINSVLGIENRGLNNLWSNGGILYAPPFR